MRGIAVLIALLPGVALAQPTPVSSQPSPPVPPLPTPQPAPADADAATIEQQAKEIARQGLARNDTALLRRAAAEFKRAMARDDQPKFECNLATVLEALGELARAHARYSRCTPRLAAIDPVTARGQLDKLAALEVKLAATAVPTRLEVSSGPATATITGFPDDELMVLPTTVWLAPGAYTLTVTFPGRRPPRTLAVEARAAELGTRPAPLRIETPAEDPLPVDDHPAIDPVPVAPIDVVQPVPPARAPRSRRVATGLAIGGGAAVIGGVVVHVLSIGKRDHLATLSEPEYGRYLSTWHRYQYATIGLYGAGTVALAAGAYLFFRDRGSPIAVTPTPAGDGATVSWTLVR